MLVSSYKLLQEAKRQGKCIPQFNIINLEWTKAILQEANYQRYPVILGINEKSINYMGGYNTVVQVVKTLIKDLNISIPVVLHLDHSRDGTNPKACLDAIASGFTSVMMDASRFDMKTNIEKTKLIVDKAKEQGVSVEGELGYIGLGKTNNGDLDGYTDYQDAINFIQATGIDSFAPAIGNYHGIYRGKLALNYDLLAQLSKKITIPIVIHGGSGISDDDIIKLVKNGASKINFNTELQMAWIKGVRQYLDKHTDIYDAREVILAGKQELRAIVRKKIQILKGN